VHLVLGHVRAEGRQFQDLMPQGLGVRARLCVAAPPAGRRLEGDGRLRRLQDGPLLQRVSRLTAATAPEGGPRGPLDGGGGRRRAARRSWWNSGSAALLRSRPSTNRAGAVASQAGRSGHPRVPEPAHPGRGPPGRRLGV
jgi:hypothetical protein